VLRALLRAPALSGTRSHNTSEGFSHESGRKQVAHPHEVVSGERQQSRELDVPFCRNQSADEKVGQFYIVQLGNMC